MSNIKESAPVGVKVTAVLEKFDGEGTDPTNLVERVHVDDPFGDNPRVAKVEFFEGADNKIGEQIFDEGGTT